MAFPSKKTQTRWKEKQAQPSKPPPPEKKNNKAQATPPVYLPQAPPSRARASLTKITAQFFSSSPPLARSLFLFPMHQGRWHFFYTRARARSLLLQLFLPLSAFIKSAPAFFSIRRRARAVPARAGIGRSCAKLALPPCYILRIDP